MMHSVFGYDPTNANPSWPLNFARDNSTVVHEAGHYFHLYHTFQGDDTNNDGVADTCPADTIVGNNSDGCADTVPHQRETSTCPATNTCDSGNPWADNNTINNIMSYYWCTDLMTSDQKTRVRAAMEGTSLVNSKGADPVDLTYVAPVSACSNNTTSTFSAGIVGVELNGVSFTSFSSGSDGGNIDLSGNCSNYFEIDATIANTLNVTMFTNNWQQLGVWIDWNDDGDFLDDAEKQHYSQDIAINTVVPIVLTYPTTIPYGDYVRIRILTDLDNRYGVPTIDDLPCSNALIYGQSEDYAIYVEPSSSSTYTYNGSWSPSDPNGASTASEDIIIASGNATINSNTTCNSLTVNAGAGLTINSGITLTTSNGLSLESSSTSYSSLILDGSVTGTINYDRHVNINGSGTTGSNDLISAPLTGQAFNAFASANSNILSNPGGTVFLFGPYDKTTGSYLTYADTETATLDAGVGYRAASDDNGTFTFTGTANNGTISNAITYGGPTEFEWNLVGNPYPSYLNVQAFLNHDVDPGAGVVTNLQLMNSGTAAIYGYDGDALNGWTVYNLANTTASTVIAPGQGFYVSADPTNAPLYDLEFTPAMRTTGTTDDFIAGREAAGTLIYFKLNASTASDGYDTEVYFNPLATLGFNFGFDAELFNNPAFVLYTELVEWVSGNPTQIALQTINTDDLADTTIPLGLRVGQGEQVTFSLTENTLPATTEVFLDDTEENIITPLHTIDYVFTPATAIDGTGRFFIRVFDETLSTTENSFNYISISAINKSKEIVVRGQLKEDTTLTLFDIQGRQVLSTQLDSSSISNHVDTSNLGAGVYIVNINNNEHNKSQKVVIN